ncbi:hypothetical protein [Vibrio spartinae]|uniref:Uncharacterized protein n=1 Tax=Vibrio spartinae TaxID=1918945 RepID=A0ABX6R3P0_9VIBR|nr:hypothetical protein [Vibrio spartinae]QMV15982.1 hypothetical protein Vspart_03356 [Vibrio spartinae]
MIIAIKLYFIRDLALGTDKLFMINHQTIVIRWVLALLLLVAVMASVNLWLSNRAVIEPMLPRPEKNNSLPPNAATLTVEKLNHQVQVKQLRQALIHKQPLSATEVVSDQDLEQQIESLEQALQQLSQEK